MTTTIKSRGRGCLSPPFLPIKDTDDRYKILISGEWICSASSAVFQNINPADKASVLGLVSDVTEDEVAAAVLAADAAFPAWRTISGNIKTRLFLKLAQILSEEPEPLARTVTREMGKTLFDSRLDIDEAIGVVECVAPQGLSMKGETYPHNMDGIVMESRLEPRGVAAIITPFNFPIAIPIAQIVAALVTGNTVVWKPSHLVPESSQAVASAIARAFAWAERHFNTSLPRGAFNMISGDSRPGQALITHPAVRCVSFTGSKSAGDRVDAVASGLGKRVMKEVGGINVFYVHRDADLARAARNFVYGKTITSGQRCTSIQEALVDAIVYEEFVAAVMRESERIVGGNGASKELADNGGEGCYTLPPLVSEEQQHRVLGLIDSAIAQGASIRYRQKIDPDLCDSGFYVPYTLLEGVDPGNIMANTEVFGPVGVLTHVRDIHEAIAIANEKIGIVACIDSRDKDATEYFIQSVLRTRVDDGRHGTGAFWATRFGGDRGAGSGNPALDENMVMGYVLWKTIYRAYTPPPRSDT